MDAVEKIIALGAIPGIGSRTIHHAYEFFGGLEQPSMEDLLRFVQMLQKSTVKKHVLEQALRKKDRILETCHRSNIRPVSFDQPNYPPKFGRLDVRPSILYVKGNEKLLANKESIGIIGTRKPSQEGRERAFRFAKRAGERGHTIISGLAAGCDTYAHMGSLDTTGRTMAIMPGGINRVYPAINEELAIRILDNQGLLVSEYEPDEKPEQYKFIARDRLQAIFSNRMLVVETDIVGGTMHTVNFAKDLDKPIAVVGYPNMDPNSRRGNRVLMIHPDYRIRCIENDGDLDRYLHEKT
ncbi:DNA-protecting protein DprA [Alkalibacter rhizosphaerae]|uniref:DNA-protecting protein DprA n=1 Tax=Alkalibacter rhizosphaerae TaxID=2815577 RepID=A0A975AHU4_9FIRM|nr:DNA-processing protein DprA [Alkalibacter rhizosphaerae]QSX08812.1 DNA-protecting protein DprA [Alkalibacter rhizosphaerae]